jgi:hypothetical protein
MRRRSEWLAELINKPALVNHGVQANMWLVANIAELAIRTDDQSAQ